MSVTSIMTKDFDDKQKLTEEELYIIICCIIKECELKEGVELLLKLGVLLGGHNNPKYILLKEDIKKIWVCLKQNLPETIKDKLLMKLIQGLSDKLGSDFILEAIK